MSQVRNAKHRLALGKFGQIWQKELLGKDISSNFFRNLYSLHNAIYEQSIVKNFNLPRKFFFVGGFFNSSAGPEALDH